MDMTKSTGMNTTVVTENEIENIISETENASSEQQTNQNDAPAQEQAPAQSSASEKKKEEKKDEKKTKKKRNVEHCKLVHEDDCIIITKDFAKRANNPSSPEFKKLAMLRREFPTYSVVARTADPSTTRPSMKGLTEKFMEKHIQTLYPGDVDEYNHQKEISEALKSPHMYMRNWFDKKYPDWRENKVRESA